MLTIVHTGDWRGSGKMAVPSPGRCDQAFETANPQGFNSSPGGFGGASRDAEACASPGGVGKRRTGQDDHGVGHRPPPPCCNKDTGLSSTLYAEKQSSTEAMHLLVQDATVTTLSQLQTPSSLPPARAESFQAACN